MTNFTTELVNSFDVREEYVHVGLAQFSADPHHEFYLNQYSKKEDVITHILNMKHTGGSTFIGKALDYITDYFEVSQGHRSGISKNLVLITDGDSYDDVEDAADRVRALGIEVFVIGIGDVHDLELLQITGTPEKLFNVRNFNSLPNIRQKFVDTICNSKPPLEPPGELKSVTLLLCLSPLLSHHIPLCLQLQVKNTFPFATGCSIDIAMGFDISRRTRAPGEILVSGHTKLQAFLPEIVRYVSSVQGLCCVNTPVKTNIAFQVVSRDGRSLYDTNFEGYSEDVVKKVMTLRMSEPTYFNTNLLNSFKEMFKAKSRAGVKVRVTQLSNLQNLQLFFIYSSGNYLRFANASSFCGHNVHSAC